MVNPRFFPFAGYCNQETFDCVADVSSPGKKLYWKETISIDEILPWGIFRTKEGKEVNMFKKRVYIIRKIKQFFSSPLNNK